MMVRKSAREIIKRILSSIENSPKSIHEIAQDTSSNWESVKIYLVSLKETGIVQENEVGNKRMFSLVPRAPQNKTGNYFDLPIKRKDEETIISLYFKIKEEWKNKTGNLPGKIQVQKTLAKINRMCSLKLPIGWYLFGAMCVKPFDPLVEYEYIGLDGKSVLCVKEAVSEYSQETSTLLLRLKQYNEEGKVLYQTKEQLSALFVSPHFSKRYVQEINNQLYNFLKNIPPIFDKDSNELVNEFVSLVLQILAVMSDEEIQFIRRDVFEAFTEIWKLTTLYQYYTDLENYYIENFNRGVLLQHMIWDMNLQKLEVIEYLSYLNDLLPQEKEPEDEAYQKLKNMFSAIKVLNEGERKQKEAELEKIKKEKSEAEMQNFLLKKAGL